VKVNPQTGVQRDVGLFGKAGYADGFETRAIGHLRSNFSRLALKKGSMV
jgi:hypothetical protein